MILVTGATGFLGSELAKQLADKGGKIVCTKRVNSVIPKLLLPYVNQISWVEADILDIFALNSALEGITQVYHCAAWVDLNPTDKTRMIKNNVEGTANVVNLCVQHGIRLLHVSSIAAIGDAKPGELITESNHLEETPHNDTYAISKYESEMEVWRGIAEGLDAVVINPSVIIGVNAGTKGSGKIFSTIYAGLKYYTSGSIGLVDVQDVAKCMIALMNSDITAERYIINAENWLYKDLFANIATKMEAKIPDTEAKPWMLNMAWRLSSVWGTLSGKPRGLDKVLAQAASQNMDYNNTKIIRATNIVFKPLETTISEICNNFTSSPK